MTDAYVPPQAEIKFSTHAVSRYIERVRPTLDYGRAAAELEAIIFNGPEIRAEPPKWTRGGEPRDGWLMIGEHVAFPLIHHRSGFLLATTCTVPGGGPHSERHTAKRRKRKRRTREVAEWRRTLGRKGKR